MLPIPASLKLYAGIALLVASAGGVAWFGHSRYKAGYEAAKLEQREADDEQQTKDRELSKFRAHEAAGIDSRTLAKQRASDALVASTRSDLERLRAALGRTPAAGPDTAQCDPERAARRQLADLLATCSGLLAEGQGIVGSAVTKIEGLQERAGVK